jgi:hypothetical protein
VVVLADLEWQGEQPLGTAYFDQGGSVVSECVHFIGPQRGEDFFSVRYRGCERRVRGRKALEASLEGFLLPPEAAKVLMMC